MCSSNPWTCLFTVAPETIGLGIFKRIWQKLVANQNQICPSKEMLMSRRLPFETPTTKKGPVRECFIRERSGITAHLQTWWVLEQPLPLPQLVTHNIIWTHHQRFSFINYSCTSVTSSRPRFLLFRLCLAFLTLGFAMMDVILHRSTHYNTRFLPIGAHYVF